MGKRDDEGWWTESGSWKQFRIELPPPPHTLPNTARDGKREEPRGMLNDKERAQIRFDKWAQFLIRVLVYVGLALLGFVAGEIPKL